MRHPSAILLSAMLLCTALVGGCASRPDGSCCARHAQAGGATSVTELPPAAQGPASGLIFDRYPGAYSASDFVGRSEWPSTDSYTRKSEYIAYRERYHDMQGPNRSSFFDYSYRRFDSIRVGEATR